MILSKDRVGDRRLNLHIQSVSLPNDIAEPSLYTFCSKWWNLSVYLIGIVHNAKAGDALYVQWMELLCILQ